MEEPGGVLVAGAGGIDNTFDRVGIDDVDLVAGDDDRTALGASQRGDGAVMTDLLEGSVKIRDLVQRTDLVLVGEQDVDLALDEPQEIFAVAVHAERIRK